MKRETYTFEIGDPDRPGEEATAVFHVREDCRCFFYEPHTGWIFPGRVSYLGGEIRIVWEDAAGISGEMAPALVDFIHTNLRDLGALAVIRRLVL